MSDRIPYHPHDCRELYLRGLVAQGLARHVTYGADALVAAAYAAAIARNARLRARFRRAQRTWERWPAWPRRVRHAQDTREGWGYDLARGREPHCYVYGPRLPVGKLDASRDDAAHDFIPSHLHERALRRSSVLHVPERRHHALLDALAPVPRRRRGLLPLPRPRRGVRARAVVGVRTAVGGPQDAGLRVADAGA